MSFLCQSIANDLVQVVVDPTINPRVMEMYADEESRAGVLEPEGMVNIKYRLQKQLDTMARLDPTYGELRKSLYDKSKSLSAEELSAIKDQMTKREQLLLPVYLQIALQFADLHDRPGRMEAKGVIRRVLHWKDSRRFFYWRLRRRMSEDPILNRMKSATPATDDDVAGDPKRLATSAADIRNGHRRVLKTWASDAIDEEEFYKNDRAVACWYEENQQLISDKIGAMKSDGVRADVVRLMQTKKDGWLEGVREGLKSLHFTEKEVLLKALADTK